MLVAEFRPVLEIFEIHVVLRDELEWSSSASRFAWMLLAHALHRVNVAETSRTTNIAIEAATVHFAQHMLALFVHHRHGQLLVQRRVTKTNGNTIAPSGVLVDWRRRFDTLWRLAFGVVLHRVVKCVLAVKLESDEQKRDWGHCAEHHVSLITSSDDQKSNDTVGNENASEEPVEDSSPVQASSLVFRAEDVPRWS